MFSTLSNHSHLYIPVVSLPTMADFTSTQDAGLVLADDLARDRARQFVELLDDSTQANYNYRQALSRMLDNGQNRLIVNLDDIRDYNRALADG